MAGASLGPFAGPPTALTETTCGKLAAAVDAAEIVKFKGADVATPPFAPRFTTVIAISPVLRFTVDVRGAPFQYAVEVPDDPEMNPVPEMKSVKDWLPAVMLAGKSALIAGVGFGVPAELLEPQPEATITINASIPNAVQRKNIKPSLL